MRGSTNTESPLCVPPDVTSSGSANCGLKTVLLICGWESVDVEGRLYALHILTYKMYAFYTMNFYSI